MLIVEDGTGRMDAESYASITEGDAYALVHVNSAWSGADDAGKENALRLGTQYLDNVYRQRWQGTRYRELQTLTWPRVGVYDADGYLVRLVVPTLVKSATIEAAFRSFAGDLMPDLTTPGTIGSISQTLGPLSKSVTYVGGNSPIPVFREIEALVRQFLGQGYRAERG